VCGIVGYIGMRAAQPVLFSCLSKLEYRGYDSCGIAVCGDKISSQKAAVRVQALQKVSPILTGSIGIGHTRWATHGLPNALNAHPHFDCTHKIAVVHNGIVSNYQSLKDQLVRQGHNVISDTDTEMIPHLIEKHYQGDLAKAVEAALQELVGSFAIAAIMEGHQEVVVSRQDSPLIIGVGDGEYFIASDVPAILEYTNRVIYLEDGDIATIKADNLSITRKGVVITPAIQQITWNRKEVDKNGFDHFMIKEIREQPKIIRDSLYDLSARVSSAAPAITLDTDLNDLMLLACGTSYHAGMIGKFLIEELLGIPVRVELGSEFNHRSRLIVPSATIAITQSGETADVLIPLKKLKKLQSKTCVITNVLGSTASRLADASIFTQAGPEVSVAATKTFIAQLIELYKLSIASPIIGSRLRESLVSDLMQIPNKVQRIIDADEQCQRCATFLADYNTVFYVGRGINYPIALEGALKLKEISYIHAEGYAAGELKHGPFALLDNKTPVIALVSQGHVYDSMINNIKEIKARQSPIIAIADEYDETIEYIADNVIRVPHVSELFSPIVNTVIVQLIAYYAAKYKGCPVDYPRNLAKSVTVE
jgi:glucosamine--fructose-6-phosphate aminotransferase (isomerizing)